MAILWSPFLLFLSAYVSLTVLYHLPIPYAHPSLFTTHQIQLESPWVYGCKATCWSKTIDERPDPIENWVLQPPPRGRHHTSSFVSNGRPHPRENHTPNPSRHYPNSFDMDGISWVPSSHLLDFLLAWSYVGLIGSCSCCVLVRAMTLVCPEDTI